MKIDVESVHEGRKYICSYCGEEFTSQSRLDGHVAFNHDRSKLYKCTFCDSEFRFEYYLKDHIALVHEKTKAMWPCESEFRITKCAFVQFGSVMIEGNMTI